MAHKVSKTRTALDGALSLASHAQSEQKYHRLRNMLLLCPTAIMAHIPLSSMHPIMSHALPLSVALLIIID